MKLLKFIWLTAHQWHNSWALREIDPTHPDLPDLVIEQTQLQDRARKLWAM